MSETGSVFSRTDSYGHSGTCIALYDNNDNHYIVKRTSLSIDSQTTEQDNLYCVPNSNKIVELSCSDAFAEIKDELASYFLILTDLICQDQ
jgi:type VI protein secretion system component VasA